MMPRPALMFLALLLLPVRATAGDSPLAVLMAQQGDVTVLRSGEALDANFGMHLDQGDEIRTGADSSADIVFATGQALQLGANGRLVVQGGEAAAAGGTSPEIFGSADRLLQLKGTRGTSAIGRVRSGGEGAEIIAVSPRFSARVGTRPVFEWSGGSGEIELTLEHEGAEVWTGTAVDAQSLQYPDDAPELVGGSSYSWRVRVADPLAISPAQSQTAFFETMTAEQESELDRTLDQLASAPVSEATRAVLEASVLFDHGLVDEAIGVMDRAIEVSGEESGLGEVRESLRVATWP